MRYIWDGTKERPFGRGGIELNFRVSDAVSIMLEGNANILSDKYNSKKADNLIGISMLWPVCASTWARLTPRRRSLLPSPNPSQFLFPLLRLWLSLLPSLHLS
jgi:hypothetical protein